jgi:hypothetical protein
MSLTNMLLCGKRSEERRKNLLTHSLKSIFATLFANSSSFDGAFSVEQQDADGTQQDEAASFSSDVPQHEASAP